MAYPEELLSPDEHIVTQFRPHWTALAVPAVLALIGLALAVLSLVYLESPTSWIIAAGLGVVWLASSIGRMLTWFTTQHVITDERVIHRTGVFSRHGKEIPLEMINNVAFGQTLFERAVRSGDLLIESAGEGGQTRYSDIPRPEQLQSLIYQVRERRIIALRGDGSSVASELGLLAQLRDRGDLTAEEFEAQKRRLLGS